MSRQSLPIDTARAPFPGERTRKVILAWAQMALQGRRSRIMRAGKRPFPSRS